MLTPAKFAESLRLARSRSGRQAVVDSWCRNYPETPVHGIQLSGCNLERLVLWRLDMEKVDFRGARCVDAHLPRLKSCCLEGVDARGACFPRSERCSLRHAQLDEAEIGGVTFRCDFSSASLCRTRWKPIEHDLSPKWLHGHNRFDGANLRGFDGRGATLTHSSFVNASLEYAMLSRARFIDCDMRRAKCAGAVFADATCVGRALTTRQLRACAVPFAKFNVPSNRTTGPERSKPKEPKSRHGMHELEKLLAKVHKYRLLWTMRRRGSFLTERVMLAADSSPRSAISGAAFRDPVREVLRVSPWVGSPSLEAITVEWAADYVDWIAIPSSIELRDIPRRLEKVVREALLLYMREQLCVEDEE